MTAILITAIVAIVAIAIILAIIICQIAKNAQAKIYVLNVK
mgnify:CR=1 FL=1